VNNNNNNMVEALKREYNIKLLKFFLKKNIQEKKEKNIAITSKNNKNLSRYLFFKKYQ
jgi:hypothetical protein